VGSCDAEGEDLMALPPILVELRASSTQFTSAMGDARSEITQLRTEGASNFQKLNQVGKAAVIGVAASAGAAAIALIKGSVDAASDLNESMSKTQTVFGDSAKAVVDFADTAATHLGASRQEALEAASTFGNLFIALQIGKKPAADMSTKLVQLAGDLGSFNNVDTATALEALRAGMLGEAEPLRKFGVSLSAARIEAEALAAGIVKPVRDSAKLRDAQVALRVALAASAKAMKDHGKDSTEFAAAQNRVDRSSEKVAAAMKGVVPELTAAQKAQASYNVIMTDTKVAQGDYARTADGLANGQKTLTATIANVRAEIGKGLLPLMKAIVPYVGAAAVKFGELTAGLEKHTTTAKVLAGIIGGLVVAALLAYAGALVHTAAVAVINFTKMIVLGNTFAATQEAGFAKSLAAAIRWAAFATASVVRALVTQTAAGAAWLAGVIARAAAASVAMLASFAAQIAAAAVWAASMVASAAIALAPFLPIIAICVAVAAAAYLLYKNWDTVWHGIKAVISAGWQFLKKHFTLILTVLFGPFGLAASLLLSHWRQVWSGIKAVLAVAWSSLKAVFNSMRSVFVTLRAAVGLVKTAFSSGFNGIKSLVKTVWAFLEPIFNKIKAGLDLVSGAVDAVKAGGGLINKGLGAVGLPKFASGTSYFSGGLAMVGEGGPELVGLPRGSSVSSNRATSRLGGGGGGGMAQVHVTLEVDGQVLHRSVQTQELRYQSRNGRRSA
jgi:hypothetical protein